MRLHNCILICMCLFVRASVCVLSPSETQPGRPCDSSRLAGGGTEGGHASRRRRTDQRRALAHPWVSSDNKQRETVETGGVQAHLPERRRTRRGPSRTRRRPWVRPSEKPRQVFTQRVGKQRAEGHERLLNILLNDLSPDGKGFFMYLFSVFQSHFNKEWKSVETSFCLVFIFSIDNEAHVVYLSHDIFFSSSSPKHPIRQFKIHCESFPDLKWLLPKNLSRKKKSWLFIFFSFMPFFLQIRGLWFVYFFLKLFLGHSNSCPHHIEQHVNVCFWLLLLFCQS